MTKPTTSSRRPSWTYEIQTFGSFGMRAYLTLSMTPTGEVFEIFANVGKEGSFVRGAFEAWARTASKALQSGTPLASIAKAIRDTQDGTATGCEGEDGERVDCSSMWDAIGQMLDRHWTGPQ